MRRLVGVLVVLLPVSMFLTGCGTKAPKNPPKVMEVQEMKMPPDIAKKLFVSRSTVKFHVSSILAKLGVEDRTQAAMSALQRGIVHLE